MPRTFGRAPWMVVAVLVIAALVWWRPWLSREHQPYSALGAGPAIGPVVPIELRPGQTACAEDFPVDPTSEVARFTVLAPGHPPGPPLRTRFGLMGESSRPGEGVAGGYRGTRPVQLRVPAPPRAALASFCVTNAGGVRVALAGTHDRTTTRETVTLDGTPIAPDLSLDFVQARSRSMLAELPLVVRHAAAFKGAFVAPWVLWLVALAVLVVVPAGIVLAVRAALRDQPTR